MSSFAKKMARKHAKELKKDGIAAVKRSGRIEKKVRHLTPREIVEDHKAVTEAYDTLAVIFDVAVHRKWGWGKERRARLHKKNGHPPAMPQGQDGQDKRYRAYRQKGDGPGARQKTLIR
jgi:hypothetical protein